MDDKLGRKPARLSGLGAHSPSKWLVSREVLFIANEHDDGADCVLSKPVAHVKFGDALGMLKSRGIMTGEPPMGSGVWSAKGVRRA